MGTIQEARESDGSEDVEDNMESPKNIDNKNVMSNNYDKSSKNLVPQQESSRILPQDSRDDFLKKNQSQILSEESIQECKSNVLDQKLAIQTFFSQEKSFQSYLSNKQQ